MNESVIFQDHMPGNICYGCGKDNHQGLQIRSYWEGEESVCIWNSEEKYQGWKGLLNGGVLATLVDCHAMCTAMAAVYKAEGRSMESEPVYRFATGTMTIKYTAPTSNTIPIEIRARVTEIKGRKVTINFKVFSGEKVSAEGEVIAIRVFSSAE
ncbi:MAG: PaaI family thioesterase [Saprospiraceae bacterium]|nr:PaaI family thioesterase [Saprospiraceae bacterium]